MHNDGNHNNRVRTFGTFGTGDIDTDIRGLATKYTDIRGLVTNYTDMRRLGPGYTGEV